MIIDPEKIIAFYWYTAIFGTIVFVLKIALPMDTGAEVSTDFTSMTDTDSSFNLLTLEGISAFFMCLGWTGWTAFSILHYELKTALIVSIVSGLAGMILFAWLISLAKKLEQINKYDLTTLVDKTGKAYVRFQPKGSGKIQVEFNSKLDIVDAKSLSDEVIESFSSVKVVKVEDNTVYIDKI